MWPSSSQAVGRAGNDKRPMRILPLHNRPNGVNVQFDVILPVQVETANCAVPVGE